MRDFITKLNSVREEGNEKKFSIERSDKVWNLRWEMHTVKAFELDYMRDFTTNLKVNSVREVGNEMKSSMEVSAEMKSAM